MELIQFADDSAYPCTFCVTSPDGLAYVALGDTSWLEAAKVFSDESRTKEMRYGDMVMTGYTELCDLSTQPYGIQAILRGGTMQERS